MKYKIIIVFCIIFLAGCVASAHQGIMETGNESQLKIRQMQTRYFDTNDKKKALECAIATLQDLGFVIDKASYDFGTVSATKLSGYNLRMTITVVPRSGDRMMVRASAQFNMQIIDDPVTYQQFFEAYSKSIFLEAHLEE